MKNPIELIENIKSKNLGKTVFIIGGGPSLNEYLPDPNILSNYPVISTNNAYSIFPFAITTLFCDRIWFQWHQKKLLSEFKNPIVTCTTPNIYSNVDYKKHGIIIFHTGVKKGGIATDPNKLNGNNAGHQAINVATHLGFKNIILLGFDMDRKSKKTHWHTGHNRTTNTANYLGTMIPGMKDIVPFQEKLGFKIYNVNKKSALKCFEFTELEKWL